MISVVTACHGNAADLPLLVHCLQLQREYGKGIHSREGTDVFWEVKGLNRVEWELVVCSDGRFFGDRSLLQDNRIWLVECPREAVESPGHSTREAGIKVARGDFVVLTNSDNYFVAGFLSSLNRALAADVGMVTWDCVNCLWKWGTQGGCHMKQGKIDLCCAAVRRDIALETGFPWRHYDADWDYLSACSNLCFRKRLIRKHVGETLAVHN